MFEVCPVPLFRVERAEQRMHVHRVRRFYEMPDECGDLLLQGPSCSIEIIVAKRWRDFFQQGIPEQVWCLPVVPQEPLRPLQQVRRRGAGDIEGSGGTRKCPLKVFEHMLGAHGSPARLIIAAKTRHRVQTQMIEKRPAESAVVDIESEHYHPTSLSGAASKRPVFVRRILRYGLGAVPHLHDPANAFCGAGKPARMARSVQQCIWKLKHKVAEWRARVKATVACQVNTAGTHWGLRLNPRFPSFTAPLLVL